MTDAERESEQPSAMLDQRILAAAHKAVAAQPQAVADVKAQSEYQPKATSTTTFKRPTWMAPLASAATVLLVVTVSYYQISDPAAPLNVYEEANTVSMTLKDAKQKTAHEQASFQDDVMPEQEQEQEASAQIASMPITEKHTSMKKMAAKPSTSMEEKSFQYQAGQSRAESVMAIGASSAKQDIDMFSSAQESDSAATVSSEVIEQDVAHVNRAKASSISQLQSQAQESLATNTIKAKPKPKLKPKLKLKPKKEISRMLMEPELAIEVQAAPADMHDTESVSAATDLAPMATSATGAASAMGFAQSTNDAANASSVGMPKKALNKENSKAKMSRTALMKHSVSSAAEQHYQDLNRQQIDKIKGEKSQWRYIKHDADYLYLQNQQKGKSTFYRCLLTVCSIPNGLDSGDLMNVSALIKPTNK